MRKRYAAVMTLVLHAGALTGCHATLDDGIATCNADEDCPSGFACRAEGGDDTRYCFSHGSMAAKDRAQTGTGGSGRTSPRREAGSSALTGGGSGGSTGGAPSTATPDQTGGTDSAGSGDGAGSPVTEPNDVAGDAECEPGVFDQSLFGDACFQ